MLDGPIADALHARCALAQARALLAVDQRNATNRATLAFRRAARLGFDCGGSGAPWPLLDEHVLEFAFERGRRLGELFRAACASDAERLARFVAARESMDAARALARRAADEKTPSAEEMLVMVRAGQRLELNCHTLQWDADWQLLAGQNAYGIEYLGGPMTLESLERWRRLMLDGEDIGPVPHPPEDAISEAQVPDEHAFRVWRAFEDLLSMQGLTFDTELQTILSVTPPHAERSDQLH